MPNLSVRHKKFADAVLQGKTLISAYYEAGYQAKKETSAYTNASVMLRNAKIQQYIKEKLAEQEAIDRMRLDRIRSDAIVEAQKLIRAGQNEDRVKADMVKDILDRTGFKPTEKIEQSGSMDIKIVSEYVNPDDTDKEE